MQNRHWRFCYWAAFLIALAAIPLNVRGAAATRPAVPLDPMVRDAIDAVDTNDLANLSQDLSHTARGMLVDLNKADLKKLTRISMFREFANYFGKINDPSAEQKQTLKWLAAQPNLLPTLMGAVSSQDPPESLLNLLTELKKSQTPALDLDKFSELATAFLVVWDKHREEDSDAQAADIESKTRIFHYFATSPSLRFDMHDLPWQLAIYVVNIRISEPEILWALDHYVHRNQIASVYFDVPYDMASYTSGAPKKIESHPYTLENLLKYGGVCVDQAYFSTQVSKTMGVPCCVCTGQGGAGRVGHAWVGYLRTTPRGVAWDLNVARYQDDLYWSADITDPHTHATLSDADVRLLAELQHVKPADRITSEALTKLADLVDPARLVDLYAKAIDLSVGNPIPWMALAQLGADQKLTDAQKELVGTVISRNIAQPYPDFACKMLMKMVTTGDIDKQIAEMDKIASLFKSRPDLMAQIRIEQGNRLRQADKTDKALVAYGEVLTNELNTGPLILRAIKPVDEILRDAKSLDRLSAIYKQVWTHMPVPDASAFAADTPYVEVGKAYAKLLDELGDHKNATSVQAKLKSLTTSTASSSSNSHG